MSFSLLFAEMSLEEKNALLKAKLLSQHPPKKQSKKIYLPLRVNKILQDEVLVKIDNHDKIWITKETLLYIASLLKKEYQKQFIIKTNADGFAPLSQVEQLGIKSRYNSQKVLIDIYLPVQLKKASVINLGHKYRYDTNNSILPEKYSGGVNLYLNEQYNPIENDENFNLSSELFLNIKDTLLEGRVNYYEKENRFERGRVRLIHDDKAHQLRYELGDIYLPTDKRMSHIEGFGVSVEKNLNIGDSYRQRNSTRINSFEFFIQNPSRVEIYINGHYRNSIRLKAGTHNLYDLHLSTGINKIKLKIIEDGGKVETIEFNDFHYSEIVQKGFLAYGLGVGIESQREEDRWHYYHDKSIGSFYINYGLLDNMTIKTAMQGANGYLSNGIETLIGTKYGLFDTYLIRSQSDNQNGYKKGIEYRTNIGASSFNIGYEDVSKGYLSYNSNSNQASTLYRANFYTPITQNMSLGLSAWDYDKEEDRERQYELLLRKNFRDWQVEFNLEHTDSEQQKDEEIISFTIEYQFRDYRSRYKHYLNEDKEQLDIRYRNRGRYGWDSGLQVDNDTKSTRYALDADYADEKFKLDSSYRINDPKQGKQNEMLSMQLSTGVVFAGDKATISTPMNSSFIIVDNDDRLKRPLGIVGYHKDSRAKYDTYAIEMGDYTYRELFVDESQLDFGIDLVRSNEKFVSNYRTGSQMNIDIDNFYSIEGFFYDKKTKQPIKNRAFKVFNPKSGKKRMSFTNQDGKFIIHHLEAGVYNITFVHQRGDKGVARYRLEIKQTDKSLQNVGRIYLEMP